MTGGTMAIGAAAARPFIEGGAIASLGWILARHRSLLRRRFSRPAWLPARRTLVGPLRRLRRSLLRRSIASAGTYQS
jgi:hypothetical protein